MLKKLQELGLTPTDIHNIEYLEERAVLNCLPSGFRWLKKSNRPDVIVYLQTFANVLEEQLTDQINISAIWLLSPEETYAIY
ncbi:hypothetical protein [Hydrotalea flava]|uniref:hypothetical protein n=1 Tax=Hydrotalea flava TaxID=714549 RepID=UPI0020A4BA92|nr:hypothetical protein [Hydrotalea flava]